MVHLDQATVDRGQEKSAEAASCSQFKLSEADVRSRFRHYHSLKEGEEHDYYAYSPCLIKGTIKFKGKTFDFETRPGHTLWTTFPDGLEKMLGGAHTDNPSGK